MSKKRKSLELITDFLDEDSINLRALRSVYDILELPINAYNFFTEKEMVVLSREMGLNKIEDFSKLDPKSPLKILPKDQRKKIKNLSSMFEERIKKAVTITTIAGRFKDSEEPTHIQKIVVVGLDNAGKTALMSNFGAKLGIVNLATLKPTPEVDRREIDTDDIKIVLWDFGGQEDYRNKYLSTPKDYFINTDLLIYVIDVQDDIRYSDSIEYFSKIVDAMVEVNANPYILVFIHKFDPDIQDEESVLLNVEHLKDLVHSTMDGKFTYEIYLTSIYSMLSNEPNFSKAIKDCLSADIYTSSTKIGEIEYLTEKMLEGILDLAKRVQALENEISSQGTQDAIYKSPKIKLFEGATEKTRKKVLRELEDVFTKWKTKKT